jgi:hypothetical protein
MFAKRLQGVDEDGAEDVDENNDDDHTRGGWSPPKAIPVAFPPPISTGGGLLTLYLCVFDLPRCSLDETPRGRIYSGFKVKTSRWVHD